MNDCKCPGCECNELVRSRIIPLHAEFVRLFNDDTAPLEALNAIGDKLEAAWLRHAELRCEIAACQEPS
jgi:hypothetical protein